MCLCESELQNEPDSTLFETVKKQKSDHNTTILGNRTAGKNAIENIGNPINFMKIWMVSTPFINIDPKMQYPS